MKLRITGNLPLLLSIFILLTVAAVDVPLWVSLFSWFLIILKMTSENFQLPALSRRLTTVLSLLFLLQIYLEFRTLLGQEPSTSLLMGLAAIKTVDYENSRDHKYLVILGFILLSMKPLFSLDVYWIPFLLCAFVGLWWSMLRPEQPKPLHFLGRLFVMSIPVALALFLIFPRFVFPWAMRANQNRAQMGFSENLNPGSAAELVETDRLVFRARFDGATQPSVQNLYWRGAVLEQSKGLSWSNLPLERKQSAPKLISGPQTEINYDIYLEPGFQNYVFALETPERIFGPHLFIRGYEKSVYRLPFPTNKTVLYHGSSDLNARDTSNPNETDLQFPPLSQRVQEWVTEHREKSETARLEELEKLFRKNKFIYTLTPGKYGENDLEEFLFDRRQGFCEHFAGSYATLARALGLPARVIVGFQGGTWNSFGQFWKVSTKDSHAWVEVFQNQSWQRIDPTAFAAPLRITLGASEYFQSLAPAQSFFENITLFKDQVLAFVENLNYSWTSFLLDFDTDFQKELVATMRTNLGWSILGLLLFALAIVGATKYFSRKSQVLHPYQLLLLDIMAWAQNHGVHRNPSDSPGSLLAKLSRTYPDFSKFTSEFGARYEETFYQEKPTPYDPSFRKSFQKLKRQRSST